jgi:CP family cyanate transporter-like MFS transporter
LKSGSLAVVLILLWLGGIALRLALLTVPPVIPLLRSELHLSGTDIGVLSALPIVTFTVAALVGSQLIARIGIVPAAVVGLLLTTLGCAGRASASDATTLFIWTILLGLGVGVTQPAMPALVGRWLPDRIGLGTGVYINGMLVGEVLPVALFPLVFPIVGASWRATFVVWAIPTAAIAILLLLAAPRGSGAAVATSHRWWPSWPAREIAKMGIVLVGASTLYFGANAFLPGWLSEAGRADLISPALTALNVGQLPASLLLIALAPRVERQVWPFVLAGVLGLSSLAVIGFVAAATTAAGAALLGFSAGASFALALTLPPLLSPPEEVARVSAAMFALGYAGTVIVVVVSGVVWDVVGTARAAFLPIGVAVLAAIVVVPTIRFGVRG